MSDHFKQLSQGRYQVWTPTGRLLGEVWKHEKRYRLRRSFVARGWRARPDGGPTAERHFDTRQAAAEFLGEEQW